MDKATVMSPTFVKATFLDPSAVHCDPLKFFFKPDVTEAGRSVIAPIIVFLNTNSKHNLKKQNMLH